MVVIMLAGVMFPLWPVKLRIGVWYLSILALGLLGALIVLAIVRLIFWCATVVVAPKAIWMFPNLFEDVGFVSPLHYNSWVLPIITHCDSTCNKSCQYALHAFFHHTSCGDPKSKSNEIVPAGPHTM